MKTTGWTVEASMDAIGVPEKDRAELLSGL